MSRTGSLSFPIRSVTGATEARWDVATGESLPLVTLASAPALTSATHLPVLDGLRGVALLLVVANHFVAAQYRELGSGVARVFHTGWVGVDLFFVLSGFLITGILWDAKGQTHYFRNFYARRALRIFPLYFAAVLGTAVVLPLIVGGSVGKGGGLARLAGQLGFLHDHQLYLWTYVSNFAQAARGAEWYMAGHFWSLAVEEHFYLVWPVIIWLIHERRNAMRFCLVVAACALVFRLTLVAMVGETVNVYFLTFCRMDSLALGGFVALAARGPGGIEPLLKPAKGIALGLGTMLGVWMLARGGLDNRTDPLMQSIGFSILGVFFAAVVVLVIALGESASHVGRIFTAPALRTVGKYSYGLYVFHHLILYVTPVVLPVSTVAKVFGSPVVGAGATIALNTLLTAIAAFASWHLFEKHFLKLKRLFLASHPLPLHYAHVPQLRALGAVPQPRADHGDQEREPL
jgi:peptidoglycan/LPS O-acetylase OafA/YrhL